MSRFVTGARSLLSSAPIITKSLSFGNNPSVVTVPDNAILHGLTACTFEAFVNIGANPAVLTRIIEYGISANQGFNFEVNTAGSSPILQVNIGNSTTTGNLQVGNVGRFAWHHVAASWDGTTILLFVDGVVQVNTTTLTGGNTGNPASTFYIGNSSTGLRGFLGLIQELRVSNIARYTTTFTVPTSQFTPDANTIGLWHINEGSGTTIADSSGNRLTGTLGGSPLPIWSNGYLTTSGVQTRSTSGARIYI